MVVSPRSIAEWKRAAVRAMATESALELDDGLILSGAVPRGLSRATAANRAMETPIAGFMSSKVVKDLYTIRLTLDLILNKMPCREGVVEGAVSQGRVYL